jgi:thiamine-monophosphate kinase
MTSSEFELIAEFFAPLATAPGAFGLKDDAAVMAPRAGCDLVVTTDMIVAGVDFLAEDPPDSIAKKALRANLSDLAAKGAEPFAYLLTLSLPQADRAWLGEFARGLRDDQEAFGCGLLGGDMSATPGPLSVAISAFGHVPSGGMIRRCGAMPGDGVFVTGTIGDSGGGLSLLRGAQAALSAEFRNTLVDRYRLPQPPVAFGASLRGLATAALDVSDGLLADLAHLAEASKVRVVVEGPLIPRSAALRALWGDGDEAVLRAATAGDDYQIAFTAPDSKEAAIAEAARDAQTTQVTRIGRVERGSGIALLDAQGREIAVSSKGFEHF